MSGDEESWSRTDPLEKAHRWAKVDLEIARKIVDEGLKRADRETQLMVETAAHLREMDVRRWRLQLITTIGALTCTVGLVAVAWLYAGSGNYAPAAAIFALGSALTGCVYGVQRANTRDAKKVLLKLEALAKHHSLPAEAGAPAS